MILQCSRGCVYDTERNIWHMRLRPGMRCPNPISYDILDTPHTRYCRRKLYQVVNGQRIKAKRRRGKGKQHG